MARAVGFVFASLPLCFGALRGLKSGADFRYIITAVVGLAAAGLAFRLSAGRMHSSWGRSFMALGVSTIAGAIAAFGQGASSAAAVGTVAVGFGICFALGGMLGVFARRAL